LMDHQRIGRSLKQQGRVPASPALARRVTAALDRIDAQAPLAEKQQRGWYATAARSLNGRGLANRAAALAAACFVSVLATWWVMDAARQSGAIERDIVSAHVRSLLQDTPIQVASSDQHTVRPWFAGRTDFAPNVKDLTAEGFPLIGGRLDYVAGRRVAATVYKRNLHVINLFMWPAGTTADRGPDIAARNGYTLLSWSQNGVAYWAISDLNAGEMRELQRLL
jgi:anti-sigma factor RsiW